MIALPSTCIGLRHSLDLYEFTHDSIIRWNLVVDLPTDIQS